MPTCTVARFPSISMLASKANAHEAGCRVRLDGCFERGDLRTVGIQCDALRFKGASLRLERLHKKGVETVWCARMLCRGRSVPSAASTITSWIDAVLCASGNLRLLPPSGMGGLPKAARCQYQTIIDTAGTSPASRVWDGAPRGRRATTRSSPGTRVRRRGSPRCAVTRARWSMGRGEAGVQSRAPRAFAHGRARATRAPRVERLDLRVSWRMAASSA